MPYTKNLLLIAIFPLNKLKLFLLSIIIMFYSSLTRKTFNDVYIGTIKWPTALPRLQVYSRIRTPWTLEAKSLRLSICSVYLLVP